MTPDSTGQAAVDRSYHWRPIDSNTPRGTKLQLIHKPSGIAQYNSIGAATWYTHYCPVPTFERPA